MLLTTSAEAQVTKSKNIATPKSQGDDGKLSNGKNEPLTNKSAPTKNAEPVDEVNGVTISKAKHKYSPRQIYQNVTVRYNYYYNSRLKLNLALKKIETSKPDDYNKILPLYTYDADGTSVSADMDEIIKKTSTAIQFHPISVWKPDCYFLMGKAYYFKKSYADALEVFQYIQTKYKIKTVKGVPIPTKKLYHQPITDDALLWLIKTYGQIGKFNEAEAITANVEARKGFPLKLKNELKVLHADLFIKNKDYKAAIPQLNTAITLTKDKKLQVRYTFITAQVYEASGDIKNAINTYRKVLNMQPEFVMDYNARKKIVLLSMASSKGVSAESRNILIQMSNDKHYRDVWDEVYYLLADLDTRAKNEKQAIIDLKQSIFYSTINATQKGLSFEKLGDIFYNKTQYILARNRYDSTLHYLPTTHDDYAPVKERKEVLDDVVAKIRIIQKEDSLQKLASLSKGDLEKKVSKMLAAMHQKQLEDSLEKLGKSIANTDNKENGKNDDDGGGWYFYNPSAKGSGYNDFIRKWGNRQLADNWRRNTKQSTVSADTKDKEDEKTDKTGDDKKDAANSELEKALANVPVSDEQRKKSDAKIINAYFDLANLYKVKLKNDKRSIETFEKLLSRYPTNKYEQECYYNLYLLYNKKPDYAKADLFKNKILDKFPNSNFAKTLKDPDFAKKKSSSAVALNNYYEETYSMYIDKKYVEVIERCNIADTMSKNNKLKPKLDFMRALCIGKTQEQPKFTASLQKIVGDYPEHEVKKKAQDLLALMNNPQKMIHDYSSKENKPAVDSTKNSKNNNSKNVKTKATYTYAPESEHYVLVWFAQVSSKNTTIVGHISNYNNKQHSLDHIDAQQQMLTDKVQLMRIKSFKSADEAADYVDEIDTKNNLFSPLTPNDYQVMTISADNYSQLMKSPDINAYGKFYEDNYNK